MHHNTHKTKLNIYFNDLLNGFGILVYLIMSHDGVDERMRLYNPPTTTGDSDNGHDNGGVDGERYPVPYNFPNLYYHVDDQQRTLSSREAVINVMFGDLLPPSPWGGGEE